MSQLYYPQHLPSLSIGCKFDGFRHHKALFSWLCHTRPELACYANRAAQVSDQTFGRDKVLERNRRIKAARDNALNTLRYEQLDISSLELRVYADASFASNNDLLSQLGFIILLCDRSNKCNVLDFSSKKSKLIVRSIKAGEVGAFSECICDLNIIFQQQIPSNMLTDSRQLLDAVTNGKGKQKNGL